MYWLEQLNKFKKEKGYTNKDISQLTGISISTLGKVMSGISKDPKLDTLRTIVYALGHTLDDLNENYDKETSQSPVLATEDQRELLQKFNNLNPFGQQALLEQARMMVEHPTYKKDDELQAFLAERDKYVKKHALPFAAAGGDTSNLAEARDLYDAKQREKKNGK